MIFNVTRKTTVCKKVEVAKTPYQKARGLMFRSSLAGGLLFTFKNGSNTSIWTFGMLFPIDILWISSKWKIVKAKTDAKPWRYLGYPKRKVAYVLELKAGALKKSRTQEGDRLKIAL